MSTTLGSNASSEDVITMSLPDGTQIVIRHPPERRKLSFPKIEWAALIDRLYLKEKFSIDSTDLGTVEDVFHELLSQTEGTRLLATALLHSQQMCLEHIKEALEQFKVPVKEIEEVAKPVHKLAKYACRDVMGFKKRLEKLESSVASLESMSVSQDKPKDVAKQGLSKKLAARLQRAPRKPVTRLQHATKSDLHEPNDFTAMRHEHDYYQKSIEGTFSHATDKELRDLREARPWPKPAPERMRTRSSTHHGTPFTPYASFFLQELGPLYESIRGNMCAAIEEDKKAQREAVVVEALADVWILDSWMNHDALLDDINGIGDTITPLRSRLENAESKIEELVAKLSLKVLNAVSSTEQSSVDSQTGDATPECLDSSPATDKPTSPLCLVSLLLTNGKTVQELSDKELREILSAFPLQFSLDHDIPACASDTGAPLDDTAADSSQTLAQPDGSDSGPTSMEATLMASETENKAAEQGSGAPTTPVAATVVAEPSHSCQSDASTPTNDSISVSDVTTTAGEAASAQDEHAAPSPAPTSSTSAASTDESEVPQTPQESPSGSGPGSPVGYRSSLPDSVPLRLELIESNAYSGTQDKPIPIPASFVSSPPIQDVLTQQTTPDTASEHGTPEPQSPEQSDSPSKENPIVEPATGDGFRGRALSNEASSDMATQDASIIQTEGMLDKLDDIVNTPHLGRKRRRCSAEDEALPADKITVVPTKRHRTHESAEETS
ncbi:hypothetical protein WOLCODRAFT_165816 [Wolfiporia cocos MD-104 SS10]|uniref:Uncharacterized protein n=1 Tax=Wolfiporia cocos (strain MD-104) TaxID=742152 RepID=A0A2H3IZB8_WOLCO|nr:hypothetical protein WOLCODRAFT_165816 [Wolfiporia cocos MD-104 SS10]